MVEVRKADITLFDQIYPLLKKFNNPNLTKADFKLLFSTQWSAEHDYCGYVLRDQEKVVGFLGTLFSERMIDGNLRKFCNITSWMVQESYRKYSLLLLLPVLKLKNHTLTNLTPSKEVSIISEKFKFKPLETAAKIFPVFPYLPRLLNLKASTDKNTIQSYLNKTDLALFHDHCLSICNHLLIYNQHEYCYLIFNKVKKKKIGFTQVYYISNLEIFKKAFPRIQLIFLRQNKTLFTLIDTRLFEDVSIGIGLKYKFEAPRLYRPCQLESGELEPEKIDNLYTELLLLRQ